jgi:hypothetical protein
MPQSCQCVPAFIEGNFCIEKRCFISEISFSVLFSSSVVGRHSDLKVSINRANTRETLALLKIFDLYIKL